MERLQRLLEQTQSQHRIEVRQLEGMQADSGVAPNEFHYSGAINACAKCGQADVAMRLFDSMGRRGVTPNAVIPALASLYDVCTCQLPCRRFQSEVLKGNGVQA